MPPSARTSVVPATLRQTEDALLDMHQECRLSRQTLRRQAEQLRETEVAAEADRRQADALRKDLASSMARTEATETLFAVELRQIERELPVREGEAKLRRQVARLRDVTADAVAGMEEARAECEWLNEQLRRAIQLPFGAHEIAHDGRGGHAESSASGEPASALLVRAVGGHGGPAALLLARDDSALEAARADFGRAIQRCHSVQMHMATCADREADLFSELDGAHRRVASLTAEVDTLRWRLARAERAGWRRYGSGADCATAGLAELPALWAAAEAATERLGADPPPPPSPSHLAAPLFPAVGSRLGAGGAETDAMTRGRMVAATAAVDAATHALASWLEEPLLPRTEPPLAPAGTSGRSRPHAPGTRPGLHSPPLRELNGSASRSRSKPATARGSSGGGHGAAVNPSAGGGGFPPAKEPLGYTAAYSASSVEAASLLRSDKTRLLASLSAERSRLAEAEAQLASRQAAHRADLAALAAARGEAAGATRALREQEEWVRLLDEMRIADIVTIQALETRLEFAAGLLQAPLPVDK